ncbi:MAG: MBL fold metallo-hydrolase [Actinobacteria bacterium]|nr:MAG: MBL fold metallo-hydrolase [Actinomycetota bacterium]
MASVDASGMFPGSNAEEVIAANADWLKPHFVDDDGMMPLSIHALVVKSMGKTIVVDTCLGNRPVAGFDAMSHLGDQFLHDFAAAGFGVEAVDFVACTHLHFDHVGFNTVLVDGQWVATFPNARYLFGRIEYEHWDAGNPGAAITFGDAVKPVFVAGLADLVDTDHKITDEVRFAPTPGHTPGHVSVHIESKGERSHRLGDVSRCRFAAGGADASRTSQRARRSAGAGDRYAFRPAHRRPHQEGQRQLPTGGLVGNRYLRGARGCWAQCEGGPPR